MADDDEEEQQRFGTWEGPRDDASGAPHGFGKAVYPSGDEYSGEMEQGTRQGQGTYAFKSSGTVYTGGYSSNKKEGVGKIVYADGSSYDGEWSNGLRQGSGLCQYANGDTYRGNWKNGKKHGQGTYHSKSGDCVFIGEWQQGHFTSGEWKFKGGSYHGAFAFGQPAQGEGEFVFSNGNKQRGHWIPLPKGEEDEPAGDEEEGVVKPPKLQWVPII